MVVVAEIGCLQRTAVVRLAFAVACSESVQLLAEGASIIGLQAAGCHKIGKSEYHLGTVVRS